MDSTQIRRSFRGSGQRPSARLTKTIAIDTGIVLVLTYLLVSAIVVFAFLFVVFALALFIGRWRERRRGQRGEE